jgi:hypothetical protein
VNGVVENMPEFQKAFSCKAGQKMGRANACHVWQEAVSDQRSAFIVVGSS